jgi:hypothetical protein
MHAETPRRVRKIATFSQHEIFEVVVVVTRSYFSIFLEKKTPEI